MRLLSAGSTVYGARAALASNPDFSGVQIATDHGHFIRDFVIAGTCDADAVIMPADMLADLGARGLLNGTARKIGLTGIGYAVRAGQSAPVIAEADGLRAAAESAEALFLTTAPTGERMLASLRALGLGEMIAGKLRQFERATEMLAALAKEDAQGLAFGPTTELLAWRTNGVSYGGAVPADFDVKLAYGAAVLNVSRHPQNAQRLLDYLSGPSGLAQFRASGVT